MAKFLVSYTTTCTSYYEEEIEAETEEEAIRLVEEQEVELKMDELDHECHKPVVNGCFAEEEGLL